MKSLLWTLIPKNPDFIALTLNLCVNISKDNSWSKGSVLILTFFSSYRVDDVSSIQLEIFSHNLWSIKSPLDQGFEIKHESLFSIVNES